MRLSDSSDEESAQRLEAGEELSSSHMESKIKKAYR